MTPTDEQLAIISAATSTKDNLIISALAGAAKTSTLVLVAEALPSTSILCLAFNKKIAEEMKARLPTNCEAKTLNSLGGSIWKDAIGRRGSIETSKNYDLLSAAIETLDPESKKVVFENFTDFLDILRTGKSSGWIPDSYPKKSQRLLSDDEFFGSTERELEDWEKDLVISVYTTGLDNAFVGKMDFDDQILMPTVFPAAYPRFPAVLIDEAQDLSPLNHQMLRKLVGTRRLIAVGDPCQAIYAFRGASSNSMRELESAFAMKKYNLTISFRCPRTVVEHARWRAPAMKYPDWAKEGSVNRWHDWEIAQIPNFAAILCRNNAPLFSLAIKFLRSGRYAELVGNDIGKNLLKTMKKLGKPSMSREDTLAAIDQWLADKTAKVRNPGTYIDRAECMKVFANQGNSLSDAMTYAEHVFNCDGPIKLMTGHKSKGLEFDDVFILEEQLLKPEGQDRNLRYVMQTRTKSSLTYIDFEGLIEPEKAPEA